MPIDGILNTIKPRGQTSFGIVSLVRRLSGERRVGHAGTLDPDAAGVLPVCLGKGTRLISFLADGKKTYRAQVELGLATDSYDSSGKVIQRGDFSSVTREQLEEALDSFRGIIQQIPPMFSAIKHHGKPLYRLARIGKEVHREPRQVCIFKLELIEWKPPLFIIDVQCSKGTYIRSIAHDIGQQLGCGAYLKDLVRLSNGFFSITDGITVSQLEEAFLYGFWDKLIYPLDAVLLGMKAMVINDNSEKAIRDGKAFSVENAGSFHQDEWCRAYSTDGRIIALLQFQEEKAQWQPTKVFI